MSVSRREFIGVNATGAAALSAGIAPLPLAFDPKDPKLVYDLLVTGGTVVDPSSKLHARRDVAIKNGQIAAVAPSLAASRATQTFDASGAYVTPGFIDMHCHYYHQVSAIGLPADELMAATLTTTGVDAGDAGYSTFSGFRHWVMGQARTRLFAFIHISSIGLAGVINANELLNIDYADVEGCAKAVAENRAACSASRCACRRASSETTAPRRSGARSPQPSSRDRGRA